MSAAHEDLVSTALVDPKAAAGWPTERCSSLFRQARAAGLLGRMSGLATWPPGAQAHADAAARVCAAQHAEIRREVDLIARALQPLGAPVILLKGAAYVVAGLPAAQGRVFSDIDILVPKAVLAEAESLLTLAGWMTTHHSAYDQRYYREWMHELPPMQHLRRGTVLDVHHTILPETARLRPDPRLLIAAAVEVPGPAGVRVLSPPDMVLHSMTHLFLNDDMSHALRDLSDLDLLLRHFGAEPGFWEALATRSVALDLRRPLYYGLRYTSALLGTPIPMAAQRAAAAAAPGGVLRRLMDAIWRSVLRSPHADARRAGYGAALFGLHVRGHWLRMPPLLLVRHLTIKALRLHERRRRDDATTPVA